MKIVFGALMSAAGASTALLANQNAGDTSYAHVALARTAAGDAYRNLFNFLCAVPVPPGSCCRSHEIALTRAA